MKISFKDVLMKPTLLRRSTFQLKSFVKLYLKEFICLRCDSNH